MQPSQDERLHDHVMHDRRKSVCLSQAQLDQIKQMIESAVEEAMKRKSEESQDALIDQAIERFNSRFYGAVGRTVVEKAIWLIGVVAVGVAFWLNSKGFLKF